MTEVKTEYIHLELLDSGILVATYLRRKKIDLAIAGEIAQRLYIAAGTVQKQRKHVREKLGAHNSVELVQAAGRIGMMG
jgi:DNA-binding CsgD family transcriptional regulator